MSLVRNISDRTSPVRRFFEERFPLVAAVRKDLVAQVRDAHTTRPEEAAGYPWDIVGAAIDYRICFAFPQVASYLPRWEYASPLGGFGLVTDKSLPRPFPAEYAAAHGEPYGPFNSWAGSFFESLREVLRTVLANRSAEKSDVALEETLARLCYVLGLYDAIAHGGPTIKSPLREKLNFPPAFLPVAEALSLLCPPNVVADLRAMTSRFYKSNAELLAAARVVELRPVFAGSADAGGADGDLIVDGCLIEVKALTDPAKYSRPWPWQLLGYVLLDYEDAWKLTSVGVYLARQGQLVRWPLEEFLTMLGGSADWSLSELRRDFRRVATAS
jgi:hypothetical protein